MGKSQAQNQERRAVMAGVRFPVNKPAGGSLFSSAMGCFLTGFSLNNLKRLMFGVKYLELAPNCFAI